MVRSSIGTQTLFRTARNPMVFHHSQSVSRYTGPIFKCSAQWGMCYSRDGTHIMAHGEQPRNWDDSFFFFHYANLIRFSWFSSSSPPLAASEPCRNSIYFSTFILLLFAQEFPIPVPATESSHIEANEAKQKKIVSTTINKPSRLDANMHRIGCVYLGVCVCVCLPLMKWGSGANEMIIITSYYYCKPIIFAQIHYVQFWTIIDAIIAEISAGFIKTYIF